MSFADVGQDFVSAVFHILEEAITRYHAWCVSSDRTVAGNPLNDDLTI